MAKITLIKRNKPKEILSLIQHDTRESLLKAKLEKYHAYDISESLLLMNHLERERLYALVKIAKLSKVFEQLDVEKAGLFVQELDKTQAAQVLEGMESDDAIDILQAIDIHSEMSHEFMSLMDDKRREHLRRLARYEQSTAGSEMNIGFVALNLEMDVKEAMKVLVEAAAKVEMIDTLFVVDEQNTLLGIVDLKELIVAKHPKKIKNLMETAFYSVHVNDDIEEVVKNIQKYDTMAMPVVNDHNQIEGIITMYDALDIIEEEAHDDLAKLAAISMNYDIRATAFKNARRRFPWLALLLVLNILVTTVLALFEETIAKIVALVLFQPLILGMAGNIGTQSLAVTILGISRETLQDKLNIVSHLVKEFAVGVINGTVLGILAFAMAYTFLSVVNIGAIEPFYIALVVGLSVFIALTVSAFLGGLIPILLNLIRIDPAVASGPFITTINDVTALVVYFGLATILITPLL